jgi:hypothetical protein
MNFSSDKKLEILNAKLEGKNHRWEHRKGHNLEYGYYSLFIGKGVATNYKVNMHDYNSTEEYLKARHPYVQEVENGWIFVDYCRDRVEADSFIEVLIKSIEADIQFFRERIAPLQPQQAASSIRECGKELERVRSKAFEICGSRGERKKLLLHIL